MSNALDFMLFGNGHGMGAPAFSQTFYWLPYRIEGTDRKFGAFYTYMAGFGAQLKSRQWFHPKAQEVRTIKGRRFKVFSSRRRWLRVEVAWCTKFPAGIDMANAELRQIKKDLDAF